MLYGKFSKLTIFQCHDDYCIAFDYHTQHNNVESAMALTEAHNNYVQQLHAANGMVDQYYTDTLPQLLQVSFSQIRCLELFRKAMVRFRSSATFGLDLTAAYFCYFLSCEL